MLLNEYELLYLTALMARIRTNSGAGTEYDADFLMGCAHSAKEACGRSPIMGNSGFGTSCKLAGILLRYPVIKEQSDKVTVREVNKLCWRLDQEMQSSQGKEDINAMVDKIFQKDTPFKFKVPESAGLPSIPPPPELQPQPMMNSYLPQSHSLLAGKISLAAALDAQSGTVGRTTSDFASTSFGPVPGVAYAAPALVKSIPSMITIPAAAVKTEQPLGPIKSLNFDTFRDATRGSAFRLYKESKGDDN